MLQNNTSTFTPRKGFGAYVAPDNLSKSGRGGCCSRVDLVDLNTALRALWRSNVGVRPAEEECGEL